MDKRLILDVLPGPVFLIGHAIGGIFLGAALSGAATGFAILMRWRWDRSLPWMAIAIFGLTSVLLVVGLVVNDTVYIKVSNTIGSVAFATIIAVGLLARPTLLERTLGYSIRMTADGWRGLHIAWISLSLARAGANEIVWRHATDQVWAYYNGISDIVWIGVFVGVTHRMAQRYWSPT